MNTFATATLATTTPDGAEIITSMMQLYGYFPITFPHNIQHIRLTHSYMISTALNTL